MGEILPLVWNTDFAAAMREHAPTMRARLRRVGIFAADIDDCMQEAFVKAWLLRAEMPCDREKRAAWLGRLAFNASSERRRELQRAHYVGSSDELARLAGKSSSSADVPVMLAEMLDRLPEQYHDMMRLRAQGYSINDIAKHYGIPWNTAKSRWDRACILMGAGDG